MYWALAFFHLIAALPTAQIEVGGTLLTVEIADVPKTRAQGLMGRKQLPEGQGMLFIYEKPEVLVFWMKNTEIPLSLAFFDSHKRLFQIEDMDPLPKGATSFPTISSKKLAIYALEVPQGWFEKKGIHPGVKFSFLDRKNEVK